MPSKPATERQHYWLDHLNAEAAGSTSLADYARNNQLKPKELYIVAMFVFSFFVPICLLLS